MVDCRFQWSNKCASHWLRVSACSLNNRPIVSSRVGCSNLGGGMTCGTIVVGRTRVDLRWNAALRAAAGASIHIKCIYARAARLCGETRYSSSPAQPHQQSNRFRQFLYTPLKSSFKPHTHTLQHRIIIFV